MKRKGLTLVEVLVVIGLILFIVTVFIFPAFERTRKKATEVVCISNLRQIGQALLMYAQDHDELVPPYCNSDEDLKISSLKAKRWRDALDPYACDMGIFFCPKDPFDGLPPQKTPSQGIPASSASDYLYARSLDHSITSYMSCPGTCVWGEDLTIEDWFAQGYHLTTDIYQNMQNYPSQWLFAPPVKELDDEIFYRYHLWAFIIGRLHDVATFASDYTHFLYTDHGGYIELFYDGSVDIDTGKRPCYVRRQLEAQYKPKEVEKR